MNNNPTPAPTVCQWFAGCYRLAVGETDHPVLGAVPICQRCADKHGLDVDPFDTPGEGPGTDYLPPRLQQFVVQALAEGAYRWPRHAEQYRRLADQFESADQVLLCYSPGPHPTEADQLVAFCEWAEAQGWLNLPDSPSSLVAEYLQQPEGD